MTFRVGSGYPLPTHAFVPTAAQLGRPRPRRRSPCAARSTRSCWRPAPNAGRSALSFSGTWRPSRPGRPTRETSGARPLVRFRGPSRALCRLR